MTVSERWSSRLVTICCVTMVALVAKRELAGRRPEQSPNAPRLVGGFDTLFSSATPLGRPNGLVRLVVFSDFECPACRRLDAALEKLTPSLGDTLAVRVVHYPLAQHRFAYQAAQAAECAAAVGAFEQYHRLLFSRQDSIGLISWVDFAKRSGVSALDEFERCAAQKSAPRVDHDSRLAEFHSLNRTPSVVLEGWLLPRTPTEQELRQYVTAFAHRQIPDEFRIGPSDR